MSRVTRKAEEAKVGRALLKFWEETNVVTNVQFGDKPDLIFELNGKRIGCEIAGIVPNRVRGAVAKGISRLTRRGTRIIRTIIPFEPHVWVQEVIRSKEERFDSYSRQMQIQGAEGLFLLLHAPLFAPFDVMDYNRPEVWSLMVWAALKTKTRYGGVFFCDQGGRISPLIGVTPMPMRAEFFNLTDGYPTYVRFDATTAWDHDLSEDDADHFFYNVPEKDTIRIEPSAPEFKQYSPRLPPGSFAVKIKSQFGEKIPEGSYNPIFFVDASRSIRLKTKWGRRVTRPRESDPAPIYSGVIIQTVEGTKFGDKLVQLPFNRNH